MGPSASSPDKTAPQPAIERLVSILWHRFQKAVARKARTTQTVWRLLHHPPNFSVISMVYGGAMQIRIVNLNHNQIESTVKTQSTAQTAGSPSSGPSSSAMQWMPIG